MSVCHKFARFMQLFQCPPDSSMGMASPRALGSTQHSHRHRSHQNAIVMHAGMSVLGPLLLRTCTLVSSSLRGGLGVTARYVVGTAHQRHRRGLSKVYLTAGRCDLAGAPLSSPGICLWSGWRVCIVRMLGLGLVDPLLLWH